jgi:hypothetical protein
MPKLTGHYPCLSEMIEHEQLLEEKPLEIFEGCPLWERPLNLIDFKQG